MTDLGVVIIVTVCVVLAVCFVRLLAHNCLSTQRYKLRDNYEDLFDSRRCDNDSSSTLLLPIIGGKR